MERLFVDTGAWFAFLNAADPDHEAVAEAIGAWDGRLLTTDYVFDELVTLCRHRVGHQAACAAGEALRCATVTMLVSVEPRDIEQAWKRFTREADKSYSFTDCTSFAVMRRLGLGKAAAVDPDFRRAGFETLPT
jgi:predicted nucleic acid-binding protein